MLKIFFITFKSSFGESGIRGNEIPGKRDSGKCNSGKRAYGELCFRENDPF
jgi:hypothetical protein